MKKINLNNEQFHNLHNWGDQRKMGRTGHVACTGVMTNIRNILVVKPVKHRPLENSLHEKT
jgi:hypothetical protein